MFTESKNITTLKYWQLGGILGALFFFLLYLVAIITKPKCTDFSFIPICVGPVGKLLLLLTLPLIFLLEFIPLGLNLTGPISYAIAIIIYGFAVGSLLGLIVGKIKRGKIKFESD